MVLVALIRNKIRIVRVENCQPFNSMAWIDAMKCLPITLFWWTPAC